MYDFAWSPDSKSIAYVTRRTPEVASANINGSSLEVAELDDQRVFKLASFPAPLEDLCWIAPDLWWRATYDLTSIISSRSVYKMSMAAKTWSRNAFGEKDCACTWGLPPGLRRVSENSLVVQVQSGLADQLHVLPEDALLYKQLHEIKSWDVTPIDGKMILAVVKSSANIPPEVYSIVGGETVCLSDHGKEFLDVEIATSEPFYAKAQDGTNLDGVLVVPKNHDLPKPWPTIFCIISNVCGA